MAFFTPSVLSEIVHRLVMNYFLMTKEVGFLRDLAISLLPHRDLDGWNMLFHQTVCL